MTTLINRFVENYQAMDIVTWMFVHFILIAIVVCLLGEAVMWAHAHIMRSLSRRKRQRGAVLKRGATPRSKSRRYQR